MVPVFFLRLAEVVVREWEQRVAGRQVVCKLLETLRGVVVVMRIELFQRRRKERLGAAGVDLWIEVAMARCREGERQKGSENYKRAASTVHAVFSWAPLCWRPIE